MRPISAGSLTAGLLLLLVVACGGEPGADAPSVTVRDSAGIRIVENSGPVWGEGEAWAVESEPEWVVGYEEELLLSGVAHLDTHPDGRVAVAHGSAAEILLLGPDGSLLNRMGRSGEGPGEFERVGMTLWMPGDTILAFDWAAGRFSYFMASGEFVRSVRVPTEMLEAQDPNLTAALADGTLVFNSWIPGMREDRIAESHLVASSSSLGDPRILGRVPTVACLGESDETCPIDSFGPIGIVAAGGGEVVHGFASDYSVRVFDPSGGLHKMIRLNRDPIPIDEEMLGRFREHVGENNFEWIENVLERRGGPPPALPHFKRIVVDDGGFIWLEESATPSSTFTGRGPYPTETFSWGIFDPDGLFLGRVEVPSRLEVHAIGPDYLIGIYRDEYDVETIRRYRLDRG